MRIESSVLPVDRSNVDTDQIIPAAHLTTVSKKGLGQFLFESLPDSPLGKKEHAGAQILLTRENFGCGSSREHAAWAILDRGFRVVVASSFARIFEENCYTNGIVPARLDPDAVEELFRWARSDPGARAVVDVPAGTVQAAGKLHRFELDPFKKQFVLEGGFLKYMESLIPEIRAWESRREILH